MTTEDGKVEFVETYKITSESLTMPTVTRVEVINSEGRVFSQWNVSDVKLSIQDNQRTLKVFMRG